MYHVNVKGKQGDCITIKVDFRGKKTIGDREGHYIIITEPIHDEDLTILTVSTSNQSSKN